MSKKADDVGQMQQADRLTEGDGSNGEKEPKRESTLNIL